MTPVVNRAVEWWRWQRAAERGVRMRARRARDRRPLVLVPSILGTQIASHEGESLWGRTRRLYVGPPIARARAAPSELLHGFTVVPRIYQYDVYGGLVRALEVAGGYRRGHDLHVLLYDWRESVLEGAARLADIVAMLRSRGPIDIVAVSTGGVVVRHFLAGTSDRIGRVVYIGTPQRGSFQSVSVLHDGLRMVPLGKRFGPAELAACKTCWDLLPHPDERVLVDEDGRALPHSIYDAATWRSLRIGPHVDDLEQHLERAHRLHAVLDAAPAHPDTVAIGGRHLPTLSRLVVRRGRAVLPACEPRPRDPLAPMLFEPGDSSLPARSLEAVPGLSSEKIRWVTPREHHRLPADPDVHRLTVEALFETAT